MYKRQVYHGLLTYNTDKYQEEMVTWWDALDVISSSGYYPIDKWDENFRRIKAVADAFDKPFFFAECGIPVSYTHLTRSLDEEFYNYYYRNDYQCCRRYGA